MPEDGSPGLRFEPLTAANEPPAGNLSPEFWRLEDRPQAAAFEKVVLEEIERRHGRKIREAIQALMNGEPKIEAAKQAHIDRKTLEDYLKKIRPWFNRRFR